MRVLITGSSGRVGSAIADLLSEDYEIVGLDLKKGPYTTHVGSVADRVLVSAVAGSVDAIIHTASLHTPDLERASSEDFFSVNVEGTRNLVEAAVANGIHRFVYSTTTSVYGEALIPKKGCAVWVTESVEPQPRDVYDETKLSAEMFCRKAAEAGGLSCVSLRFSRCFPEPAYLVATYRLYRGVDVRDVAEAHRLALVGTIEGFQVFNISARSPFAPEDCCQLLSDPRPVLRAHFPDIGDVFAARGWPLPQSIDRVYAIDEAELRLGYNPRYNFQEYILGAV